MVSDERATIQTRPAGELVEGFREWLVSERRLAASTVKYYVRGARLFLGEQDGRDLAGLALGEVSSFMVGECRRLGVGSAKNLATGLRSLLWYLYLEGVTDRELAQAVPAPASRRGGGLPRGLGAGEVTALLAGCDDSTALGRRDHAIVVVLVRLGLRAREVAALTLDDVDWVHGEVVVRGKGNHTERLPLPVDVGEALVGYLQDGRPETTCRALFLRAQAPRVGLSTAGVSSVARGACMAAGVPCGSAHRLRHSAATAMLRAGASLDEVGQVLRQRDPQTTSAYAKVDFVALRRLAQPWPERVA
jgi:site-specific recombinase XerD